MPFLGVQPTDTFAAVAKQTITGDGSTAYTLTHSVASANDLAVFVNNVRQEPTTAYSASGTSITFTEAIASTDSCYVVYIARTFQTLSPPDNSVNADQISYPLTNFSSTGIDDNADATAITIDSSERVGIGTTQPESSLQVSGEIDDTPSSQGVHLGMTANYANIQLASASDTGGFIDFTSADGTNYDGRIIYRHSSNQIEFATNSVSTPKVTILSSGGITFNGDTAAANALDDYEEGTWTPTSSSNISAIANVSGNYTKIGNVVHVSFFADITPTSSSTQIRIGGLPYAVADKISGTSFEGTGVIFEDSSLYFFAAFGGSSDLWIEYDRPMQGSATTTNRSYRGSVVYYAA